MARNFRLGLALCFFTLVSASCAKQQDQAVASATVTIQIVHGPEVRPYLSAMAERFAGMNPTLPDGSKIALELVSELGIAAAKMIASGEIKPHGWLASSSSLVNVANSNLANLGARQSDCTQLFSTPTVIAVPTALQSALGARAQQFNWNKLFTSRVLQENGDGKTIRYSHGDPQGSVSGLSAVLQLAAFAGSVSDWSPANAEKLRTYEEQISQYSLSESNLLDRAARSVPEHIRFVITSEQQLVTYNKQHAHSGAPLVGLYPDQDAIWQDYAFCGSDAEWITPAERAAVLKFQNFLSTPDAQHAVADNGFRPSISKEVNPAVFGPQLGVNLDLPSHSLPPASASFVNQLLQNWGKLTEPVAVLFVAEASSNVEGDMLRGIKDALRGSLVRLPERAKTALISFSTEPTLRLPFTDDMSVAIPVLDQFQPLGGSALYDAIKFAVDTISVPDLKKYRRTIVVLTAGEGNSSEMSRSALHAFLNEKLTREDLNIVIVGIKHDGSNYSELQALSQDSDTVFKEAPIGELEATVEDLIKNL